MESWTYMALLSCSSTWYCYWLWSFNSASSRTGEHLELHWTYCYDDWGLIIAIQIVEFDTPLESYTKGRWNFQKHVFEVLNFWKAWSGGAGKSKCIECIELILYPYIYSDVMDTVDQSTCSSYPFSHPGNEEMSAMNLEVVEATKGSQQL